jgi:hypothetical protein
MVEIRSQASVSRLMHTRLVPSTSMAFNAAAAASSGVAASLAGSDLLALGKAGKAAGLGMALIGSRNAAMLFFPGATDKPKHAMACAAITGTVSVLSGNRFIGIGAGVAAALLKECYDGSRFNPKGNRDFHLNGDLGADAIGIAMGALIR